MTGPTNLKNAGLRITQPRLKIMQILQQSAVRHLTADDVYQQLQLLGEDIGLATVYRVLTQFETAGLLVRHNFEGGRAIFECNDSGHHDHYFCVKCGRVFEFCDATLERRQQKIADTAGFAIDDHAMYLYGTCKGMAEDGVCSVPEDDPFEVQATPASTVHRTGPR